MYNASYIRYLRVLKIIETDCRLMLARSGEGEIGELLFNGYTVKVTLNETIYGNC